MSMTLFKVLARLVCATYIPGWLHEIVHVDMLDIYKFCLIVKLSVNFFYNEIIRINLNYRSTPAENSRNHLPCHSSMMMPLSWKNINEKPPLVVFPYHVSVVLITY